MKQEILSLPKEQRLPALMQLKKALRDRPKKESPKSMKK